MILGLSFALVCALGTNLSSLLKARGAVLARPIEVRHPLRSAADLFRQRWFAVGWILALFAWGLHIEALADALLSSVQAVLSGGLVFLAVVAERFFGFHLGRRQWGGVTLTAAGLAVIGLTATSEGPQRSSLAALIVAETAILGLGVGLVRISTRPNSCNLGRRRSDRGRDCCRASTAGLVGAATPLLSLVVRPRAGSGRACPALTASSGWGSVLPEREARLRLRRRSMRAATPEGFAAV